MRGQFIYSKMLDDKAIEEIATIIEMVERDNEEEAMIICDSSVEQTIKRAFPNKPVLCLTDIISCGDKSVWVVPNNKGKLTVEYN